eukprot:752721-Hanusia_phi.AAC.2
MSTTPPRSSEYLPTAIASFGETGSPTTWSPSSITGPRRLSPITGAGALVAGARGRRERRIERRTQTCPRLIPTQEGNCYQDEHVDTQR